MLSERWLRATHPDVEPDDLLYTIVDRPRNGYLEHTVRQRVIRRRFTQRDVDNRKVVYVINDKTQATNDSFTFRLQDRHSNTLDNQRLVATRVKITFLLVAISVACYDFPYYYILHVMRIIQQLVISPHLSVDALLLSSLE